ncbi:BTAD domain-containing putative transcriptional regulator [Nonomuraea sp. CA-141351]|uniref:AfsR/SARP family transcriptional regulator n=1 Tax=Nonomuraea sp. CA-141351 TaxID=3239996 RepID=UPI003D8B3885
MDVEFAILGPLEARRGAVQLDLGPFKRRALLAALLVRINNVVSVPSLIEAAWGDAPPRTAQKNLQVYVAALRKDLGLRDDLLYVPPGYRLRLPARQLDMVSFTELVKSGKRALRGGDTRTARRLLGDALNLWRGDPLPDLAQVPLIAAEVARLTDLRLTAFEDWVEAELDLGHHARVVDVLTEWVRENPFRERLRRCQMLALYRCGRQTEALAEFESLRQALTRELGLRPSPVLERLYQAILRGDEDLYPPHLENDTVAHMSMLPRDLADFAGRDQQILDILDAFEEEKLNPPVVLFGPAGSGKTSLAVHVAHRLRARFPDGQLFVGLRDASGAERGTAEIVAEVLRLTGFGVDLPESPEERLATYRAWLAERRFLLVLDDAAAPAQVRCLIPGTGDSGVIVTSRRRLDAVESVHHVPVGAFDQSEALELLRKLIGDRRITADPVAARRLLAAAGCSPMTIRLAGARLAARPDLSLSDFTARLADDRLLLDELTVGDRSLRACAASLERDLDPSTHQALRRLGALPDEQFTLGDAAPLLGPDVAQAVLDTLEEAQVIEIESRADAVYRIPRWVRLFARESAMREGA